MKIRNGFVSNSSSSSFIVQVEKEALHSNRDNQMIVNEESIPILEEYGFIETCRRSPFSEVPHDKWEEKKFMYYSITCNEEDVIEFLVKNNIPFKASCHYGHRFVQFEKDADSYLKAYNFGMEIDMYGFSGESFDWEQVCRKPKLEMVYVGHLIEDEDNED